ncbi:hypothetical protein [Streptomyces sp. RPA4-5]|uniref:hypothetical protein n=1 Tax=Streptomyces sp. RPA4-5 TaxID=2721245 RepID=UPI002001E3A7|nr:hypothetical protein [Streptomyces sp. RPA4-5]
MVQLQEGALAPAAPGRYEVAREARRDQGLDHVGVEPAVGLSGGRVVRRRGGDVPGRRQQRG